MARSASQENILENGPVTTNATSEPKAIPFTIHYESMPRFLQRFGSIPMSPGQPNYQQHENLAISRFENLESRTTPRDHRFSVPRLSTKLVSNYESTTGVCESRFGNLGFSDSLKLKTNFSQRLRRITVTPVRLRITLALGSPFDPQFTPVG